MVDVVTGLAPQVVWSEHGVGRLHVGGVVVVVERLRSGHHQSYQISQIESFCNIQQSTLLIGYHIYQDTRWCIVPATRASIVLGAVS